MKKTYYIAMVYSSKGSNLTFILDKPARIPVDLFWLLVSDKLKEQGNGQDEKFEDALKTVRAHFDSTDKKEIALIIHNINFSIKIKK